MRNIMMQVTYVGTKYNGFQSQPVGDTIQDRLEAAIFQLTREPIRIIASGRTDAKVHARAQVFNFLTTSNIPIKQWIRAMNRFLPADIQVFSAREVPLQFHARKHAISKTYRYTLNLNPLPDIFRSEFQNHIPWPLDLDKMKQALPYFVGEHDFTTFCSTHTAKESKVRTIYRFWMEQEPSEVENVENHVWHFYCYGNGFLYNMVRTIMGTLIAIGEGKKDPADLPEMFAAKDRSKAGMTAVPHGLMLWNVNYSSEFLDISD